MSSSPAGINFGAVDYFYIALASQSDTDTTTYVVTYAEPSVLPSGVNPAAFTSSAFTAAGAISNTLTNTVASTIGVSNKLALNQPRLKLTPRSDDINQRWTVDVDGAIVSSSQRAYRLGGKPARIHELKALNSSPQPPTNPLNAFVMTGAVEMSDALTAADMTTTRLGLNGLSCVITRPSSHQNDSSVFRKQLAVRRQCCGDPACERERVRSGSEVDFVLDDETDVDEPNNNNDNNNKTTSNAATEQHTSSVARNNSAPIQPSAASSAAAPPDSYGIRSLLGFGRKRSLERVQHNDAVAEVQKAQILAARQQKLDAERARENFSTQTVKPTSSAPIQHIRRRLPGTVLDMHQWRILTDFSVFVNEYIQPVLVDLSAHEAFDAYAAQTAKAIAADEAKRSESAHRSPIKTSFDYDWRELWNNDGTGSSAPVSVWRAEVPASYVIFGDFVHKARSPPTERLVVAQMHPAFVKPKGFHLVWVKRGRQTMYVWSPVPASDDHVVLGHYVTLTPDPPDPQHTNVVCVNRSYVKDSRHSLPATAEMWNGTDGTLFRMPQPLNTLICSANSRSPPTGSYYTLLEPYEPSEPAPLSRPIDLIEGGGNDYTLEWDDRGSLTAANDDISFWRPNVGDGCVRFGDLGIRGYNPSPFSPLTARDHPAFRRPLKYELEYRVHRNNKRCSIWRPIPAFEDYVALGFVVTANNEPPSADVIRCVHKNVLLPYGKFRQAWIEQSGAGELASLVSNLNVLAVARSVAGSDRWGECALWSNVTMSTFIAQRGTHGAVPLPHYRLPLSSKEHERVIKRLQGNGSELVKRCVNVLERAIAQLEQSQYRSLGMTTRQACVFLSAIQKTYDSVEGTSAAAFKGLMSPEFEAFLKSERPRFSAIQSALKRFLYETVSRETTDVDSAVTALETLHPLFPLLSDIDASDRLDQWKLKPKIRGKEHKSTLISLFDDRIGAMIADRFEQLFPITATTAPSFNIDDNDGDTDTGPATTVIGNDPNAAKSLPTEASGVDAILTKLSEVLDDLKAVSFGSEDVEIRRLFLEYYHRYIKSTMSRLIHPNHMPMSELLNTVRFTTRYRSIIHLLLPPNTTTDRTALELVRSIHVDLDKFVDVCMDCHDSLSKEKIIGWVSNIVRNEQNAVAEKDETGYYATTGPQDLFVNINSLFEHAVGLKLGGKPLLRIAMMYCHVILYYQDCLKRFIASLENDDPATPNSTNNNSYSNNNNNSNHSSNNAITSNNNAVTASKPNPRRKPDHYFYALINDSKHYEDNADELNHHCLSTLDDCNAEDLDSLDASFDEVNDGFFDVAVSVCSIITRRTVQHFIPAMSQIMTPQHINDSAYLSSRVLDPLSDAFEPIGRGISRDAFVKKIILSVLTAVLSMYDTALINGIRGISRSGGGTTLDVIVSTAKRDRADISKFFSDYSSIVADSETARLFILLDDVVQLAKCPPNAINTNITGTVTRHSENLLLTPYVIVSSVLTARTDISEEQRRTALAAVQVPSETTGTSATSEELPVQAAASNAQFEYVLSINVQSGEGLAIKDSTSSDPFVIVYLLESVSDVNVRNAITSRKTSYRPQTLSPVWNTTFDDFTSKQTAIVKAIVFEVWDHDVIGSDFMGLATVTIEQITAAQLKSRTSNTSERTPINFTLSLKQRAGVASEGKNVVSGRITVAIAYYPRLAQQASIENIKLAPAQKAPTTNFHIAMPNMNVQMPNINMNIHVPTMTMPTLYAQQKPQPQAAARGQGVTAAAPHPQPSLPRPQPHNVPPKENSESALLSYFIGKKTTAGSRRQSARMDRVTATKERSQTLQAIREKAAKDTGTLTQAINSKTSAQQQECVVM